MLFFHTTYTTYTTDTALTVATRTILKVAHSIGLRPHPPTPKNERIVWTRRAVTILSSCLAHCVRTFSKLI